MQNSWIQELTASFNYHSRSWSECVSSRKQRRLTKMLMLDERYGADASLMCVCTLQTLTNLQTWKKFGVVEGKPPGPEPGITTVGDEVYLILNQKQLVRATVIVSCYRTSSVDPHYFHRKCALPKSVPRRSSQCSFLKAHSVKYVARMFPPLKAST